MGWMDKLRAELVDIVEWVDDSRHTLVWRFPRYHNQLKHGARLVVRPGQLAIFVRELGPTGEGLLRFELRRLGRGDSELRPSDLKRLADRVDVALETMVEIVDVPEARRRLQEKLGAIRRQMGLIEEEGV